MGTHGCPETAGRRARYAHRSRCPANVGLLLHRTVITGLGWSVTSVPVYSPRVSARTVYRQLCRVPTVQTGGHRHNTPAAEPKKQENGDSRRSGFIHATPEERPPLIDALPRGGDDAPLGQQGVPLPAQPAQVVPTLVPSQVVPPSRRPSQSHTAHTSQRLKETILDVTCQSLSSFDDEDLAASSIASPGPIQYPGHSMGSAQPLSQQVRQYVLCAASGIQLCPFPCSGIAGFLVHSADLHRARVTW